MSKELDDVNFDDVLEKVGSFGKFQKLTIFLVFLPALIPDSVLVLNSVFMAATPSDHWCKLPYQNLTKEQTTSLLPKDLRGGTLTYSKCTMFEANYSSIDFGDAVGIYSLRNRSRLPEVHCQNGYEFDQSIYESTIVTEFGLVCDKNLQSAASFTYFTLGGLFGPLLWGLLADRFGRRFGFFSCVTFQSIFALATGFAPNYILYCVFRFCVGMTTSASYSLPMSMCMEICGPNVRALMAVLCSVAYTSGALLLGLLAYFVRSWRDLALYSSAPLVIIFMALYAFFPESPRWLLLQGRYEQLEIFLRKVARVNGRRLDPEFSDRLPQLLHQIRRGSSEKQHTILDVFVLPNMRKKTVILVLVNLCNKGVFMGLNYYAPGFGYDPHWNYMLANLIELPPYIFSEFFCDRFGRRACLFFGMILGSFAGLATTFLPVSSTVAILALSLSAKFFITFTYLVGELMEDEIFPTVIRGEGHSITSAVSSIAGCATPFVVHLGHQYLVLPLIIYGGCCLMAAFTALFLPETADQDLPQTLEDGENFGKNMTWKEIFSFKKRKARTRPETRIDMAERVSLKSMSPVDA